MNCPLCAEEIQGEAVICRFCNASKGSDGEWVAAGAEPNQPAKKPASNELGAGCIVATLIAFALVVAIYWVNSSNSGPSTTTLLHANPPVLSIDGNGTADVTYRSISGTVQQTVKLPWSTTVANNTSFLYISAQKKDAVGAISCKIESDGRVVATNASNGQYAIVTCEA